jgi:hypothetical protein
VPRNQISSDPIILQTTPPPRASSPPTNSCTLSAQRSLTSLMVPQSALSTIHDLGDIDNLWCVSVCTPKCLRLFRRSETNLPSPLRHAIDVVRRKSNVTVLCPLLTALHADLSESGDGLRSCKSCVVSAIDRVLKQGIIIGSTIGLSAATHVQFENIVVLPRTSLDICRSVSIMLSDCYGQLVFTMSS